MFLFREKTKMIDPERALPGRDAEMPVPARHEVLGTPLRPPFPDGLEQQRGRHPEVPGGLPDHGLADVSGVAGTARWREQATQ